MRVAIRHRHNSFDEQSYVIAAQDNNIASTDSGCAVDE
jgi:hypothetical protein